MKLTFAAAFTLLSIAPIYAAPPTEAAWVLLGLDIHYANRNH